MKNKKGMALDMESVMLTLVVVAILAGIGAMTIGGFKERACSNATNHSSGIEACQQTVVVQGAYGDFVDWIPTIVLIIAVVILLGYVFLLRRQAGGSM